MLLAPGLRHKHQIFISFLKESDAAMAYCSKVFKYPNVQTYIINLSQSTPSVYVMRKTDGGLIQYRRSTIDKAFRTMTSNTRIYIDAHGEAGSDYLFFGKREELHISVAELVAFLVAKIPASMKGRFQSILENKLTISLLACDGGIPDLKQPSLEHHINNSFGARLLYKLYLAQVDCVIKARLGAVDFTQDSSDKWKSKIIMRNQLRDDSSPDFYCKNDNASKVIYHYVDSRQVISKAYNNTNDWRGDVLDTINDCILQTKVESKKQGLCHLLNDIFLLDTDKEIFDVVNKALFGVGGHIYHVHDHSSIFGFGDTRTFIELQKLLHRFPWNQNS